MREANCVVIKPTNQQKLVASFPHQLEVDFKNSFISNVMGFAIVFLNENNLNFEHHTN